ncbi:MAG: SPFH domain-containing protein [Planctomycetota bacterium]|jgi:membrane protease subunit HflK
MTISSKRAEYVALTSLVISVVSFFITFLLSRWSGYFAIFEVSWFLLATTGISLVLVIQFHQHSLAQREKLDIGQLEAEKKSSTIFQSDNETTALFAVAQKRLKIFNKWFLPIFSTLIAVYMILIGLYLLKSLIVGIETENKQALVCAVSSAAIAFVSFLISRYATGMATKIQWKPLRACGSFLFASAVFCFLLAVSLAFAHFKIFVFINIIVWIIPILLVLLGAETALNVVLDIYRPRLKDQYGRAAFDSRLLGTISEPGEILHTAASAIDYQFGFKVSQTWFYKLLEKAVIPLVLFGAFVLYLLSCIVVVAPNEEAIIEHLGNPLKASGQVRKIEPGLILKWPWPIDVTYRYPTKAISEISVGFVHKTDPNGQIERGPKLWGKPHYEKEYNLLVASEYTTSDSDSEAVPISLIKANVPIQYRVKDLYAFMYNYGVSKKRIGTPKTYEAVKMLEAICYRELTKFGTSAKIEVDDENLENSLLGAGRLKAKKHLMQSIQEAIDKANLGIELVFVGLQGIHPPSEVTSDYQKVIGAIQIKNALVLKAHAQRNKDLTALAGSVKNADKLYALAEKYQKAVEQNNSKQIDEFGQELDTAFSGASGDIFKTLADSQSYAFEKSALSYATGLRFAGQLKAYQSAKEIYKHNQRLSVLEESLENIRKYVVVADQNDSQVFIVDVKEKLTPGLYDLAGIEESE